MPAMIGKILIRAFFICTLQDWAVPGSFDALDTTLGLREN
jgi:hypothetical protein